jgi:two-component system nitrogen regulation response regulator GlnG
MTLPLESIRPMSTPPLAQRPRRTAVGAADGLGPGTPIVGESPAITRLLAEVRQLAQTDAKVLITGESGTGKELIASFIHSTSRRVDRPFVAVNCAGMPETLLESELFGHVKGSFTGAYADRPGRFEVAHLGTLFLDEVGEMTLRMQGLLLRVLETGEIQKVGADRFTVRTDARVVAATNRNLAEMVQQGLFREDLFYRLNVIRVHVPPLRERAEDIPLLADHLLSRATKGFDRALRFAPDVYAALQAWHWPGNVRQLDNIVQRLAVSARDGVITVQDLPAEIQSVATPALPPPRAERRRTAGDRLYERILAGGSFWDIVHRPYVEHEITRDDVRAVVRKGLEAARGNYRIATRLFNVEPEDYKRLLNFLRTHQCLLPYREFR